MSSTDRFRPARRRAAAIPAAPPPTIATSTRLIALGTIITQLQLEKAAGAPNILASETSSSSWTRFCRIAMTTYPSLLPDTNNDLTAVVVRERTRLVKFIRRRVPNQADAEDILQDVLYEFVDAYRLPASIEQVSAWLFRVARNRIIDRFRKKKEQSLDSAAGHEDEYRLDFALPSTAAGPEAEYARSVMLTAMQQALAELPDQQREVFVAHELEGHSFKAMAARSGIAVNTLLSRKRAAVLYLRARLQSTYDELEF
jgi:RNA polymerase sigma factor (sigma-70 family)